MDDHLNHYCETIIRSPLPIFLRSSFTYVIVIVYCVVQAYTCNQLSRWRQSRLRTKGNTTTEMSDVIQNATDIVSVSTNSTTTLFVYDLQQSSSNLSTATTSGNLTTSIAEDISPLFGHAVAVPFLLFAFMICIFVCRVRYQSVYACAIHYVNLIDPKDVYECKKLRSGYVRNKNLDYFEEDTLKKVLTMREQGSFYAFWTTLSFWKPNLGFSSGGVISYPSIDCTLADYMFCNLCREGGYQIIGAIELIHEIMKGLDYLHYRNVYHLDLTSESVKLHCNGKKVYVKLTNFNFMKKSPDRKVSSTSVGLRGFYRPLECSADQVVDAEKCDIWGLGLVSLDLFTGGLYRIKSESGDWDEQRCEDLISTFTQISCFSSYLEAVYGVVDMFTHARYHSSSVFEMRWASDQLGFAIVTEYPYKSYNVNHTSFLYNIRCFVYRLLIFSPRRRISLQRAFEEPLILNRGFPRKK